MLSDWRLKLATLLAPSTWTKMPDPPSCENDVLTEASTFNWLPPVTLNKAPVFPLLSPVTLRSVKLAFEFEATVASMALTRLF